MAVWGFCHITRTLEVSLWLCWWRKPRCLGTKDILRYFILNTHTRCPPSAPYPTCLTSPNLAHLVRLLTTPGAVFSLSVHSPPLPSPAEERLQAVELSCPNQQLQGGSVTRRHSTSPPWRFHWEGGEEQPRGKSGQGGRWDARRSFCGSGCRC